MEAISSAKARLFAPSQDHYPSGQPTETNRTEAQPDQAVAPVSGAEGAANQTDKPAPDAGNSSSIGTNDVQIQFSKDDSTQTIVQSAVDRETGEAVWQFPSEAAMHVRRYLEAESLTDAGSGATTRSQTV